MRTTYSFSRRRFLQSAATAAVAAPFILPSHVWAAEKSPNDRITLGVIGTGKQGRGLMGGFLSKKDDQVVAVCDVDTTRRESAKKMVEDAYAKQNDASFKGCAAYNDFRDLLARKDIDAVVIATPDHWHAYIAIAAAKAGKDIYCEKPLTQSIHEARAIVNAVKKHKRVFQTGSMQRSSKEFRQACELVRNGRIGKLQRIEAGVGGPAIWCNLPESAPPPGLDWDLWLGPAAKRGWNEILSPTGVHNHFPRWRDYREYGGGGITDWGAHHFDIAQWGMGMDRSGPVEIIPPAEVGAQSGVKFRYANGVEMTHIKENGVTFFGTEGTIFVNRGKFKATPEKIALEPLGAGDVRLYESTDHKADWLGCIRSRKDPITDAETGARSVTVCHLANLAYWNMQTLKWNPEKEQFVGGTGNKKWLDVPVRGGWKLS